MLPFVTYRTVRIEGKYDPSKQQTREKAIESAVTKVIADARSHTHTIEDGVKIIGIADWTENPSTFSGSLKELLSQALQSINKHPVHIVLPTGDRAIDFDDAWLLIDRPDGEPVLRNKKEQRLIEAGEKPGTYEDTKFSKVNDPEDICRLADKLHNQIIRHYSAC